MQNDQGKVVERFIPRKCSATQSIIQPKDHASVQINIKKVNGKGDLIDQEFDSFIFCGKLRAGGKSDRAMNRLACEMGLMKGVYKF
ncbi:40S ribosomal protein S21 [Anaeramoeba flamelloides]|uniref:40S ribosomal protein S21 n=1 Tax=Anaeramoeba flamelloides TaxID=1746091 RepID=A0AAV7ZBS6_9EUKA|nr:40S ribosomal protein S21 [Anaeramoeba flamelloides]KAJ6230250.1 40S ribosomal protein S21 [Anaeramoeba flamelloides]